MQKSDETTLQPNKTVHRHVSESSPITSKCPGCWWCIWCGGLTGCPASTGSIPPPCSPPPCWSMSSSGSMSLPKRIPPPRDGSQRPPNRIASTQLPVAALSRSCQCDDRSRRSIYGVVSEPTKQLRVGEQLFPIPGVPIPGSVAPGAGKSECCHQPTTTQLCTATPGEMRSISLLALLPGVSGFALPPAARRSAAGENDGRQQQAKPSSVARPSSCGRRAGGGAGRLFSADSGSGRSGAGVAMEPRRKEWFATKAQETVDYSNVEAM